MITAWPNLSRILGIVAVATAAFLLPVIPAMGSIQVALVTPSVDVDPGATFDVELEIGAAGDTFNAYDVRIFYDTRYLTLVELDPIDAQEGALMTGGCAFRYHDFQHDAFAGEVRMVHSLLCSGVTITGPGVLYQLRFEAVSNPATTTLQWTSAEFANGGIFVTPVETEDLQILIGGGATSVSPPERQPSISASPNPFNPRSTLVYNVPRSGSVLLAIHDSRGRHVRTLVRAEMPAGQHRTIWDGRDEAGRPLASGTYHARLETAGGSTVRSVSLVR